MDGTGYENINNMDLLEVVKTTPQVTFLELELADRLRAAIIHIDELVREKGRALAGED